MEMEAAMMAPTEESSTNSAPEYPEPTELEPRSASPNTQFSEESLVENFRNMELKEGHSNGGLQINDLHSRSETDTAIFQFPLRPYAGDCQYYLKTGACKFGPNCRFNHPVKRAEKEITVVPEKTTWIECKYFLTPGGCKFGDACRFNHSKETYEIITEAALPELNFLSLPIRRGKKECPFYMRTGSCGYGAKCIFHHPDPTTVGVGETNPNLLEPNCVSMGEYDHSSVYKTCEYVQRLDEHSFYKQDDTHLLLQRLHLKIEQNEYQHKQMQAEEYPERPGQPECVYFIKTGACKYRSSCRYHHPKGGSTNPNNCAVNDKGLPLRPGKKVCWHYERLGICKYGCSCLFDHPVSSSLESSSALC